MSKNNAKKHGEIQLKEHEVYQINDHRGSASTTGPIIGCRHVQVVLICFGLVFGIGSRSNLPVAIVAMTDNTTSPNPTIPSYDWNNTNLILSSFFWTYLSLQVVAGYVGKTYGPKYFLLVGFFVNCCASALTPLAADKLGSTGVMLCRIIQGFGLGFLYPSVNVLLGRWVPNEERTTLCNIAFTGDAFGTMSASLLTGYVSASWWGWPASFYIWSSMGFCWCIMWLCFGQNSPAAHPSITIEEKNYIQSSLKQKDNLNIPIPWMKIFTCVPFYALIVAQIGNVWSYAVLTTATPTFLAKVMKFDVKLNALVTSMPILVNLFGGLLMGGISDWVISRKMLSRFNARRIFHMVGCYGQAVCIVWLAYLKPSKASWSITILGLDNAILSFVLVGSFVNHLDLSPRFSGVIFGLINTVGEAVSILGPLSANWIVTDTNALVTSMPILVNLFGGLLMGGISDWVISRKMLSRFNARRIFHMIGCYGQAVCIVWLAYLKPSKASWSITILGLDNAILSFVLVGSFVNHLDLSPRFSGVIFGLINTVGEAVSILGPLSANWIVTDTANASQWQIVFCIAAGSLVLGGTVFFFFSSASRQPWDGPEDTELEETKKVASIS